MVSIAKCCRDLFGHTAIITADNYFGELEEEQHVEVAKNYISFQSIEKRRTSQKQRKELNSRFLTKPSRKYYTPAVSMVIFSKFTSMKSKGHLPADIYIINLWLAAFLIALALYVLIAES